MITFLITVTITLSTLVNVVLFLAHYPTVVAGSKYSSSDCECLNYANGLFMHSVVHCTVHPERLWQILPVYGNFYPFIRLPAPPGALVPIRESRLPASKCTLNVRHTDYSEKINSYRWQNGAQHVCTPGRPRCNCPKFSA